METAVNIIKHRRNTIEELIATPSQYGVEVDIRSYGDALVVHHEPFTPGPLLVDWLRHFRHGTLILNVKEEGLEENILRLVHTQGITDYFFLDQSFPFLIKTARNGERRCAVRVSEFESLETALQVAPLVDWVWVDCFTRFPLTQADAHKLQTAGLKLCLVSPELQGFEPEESIPALRDLLLQEGIFAEAVCTKRPDLWER